jgi:hypothetical protein
MYVDMPNITFPNSALPVTLPETVPETPNVVVKGIS